MKYDITIDSEGISKIVSLGDFTVKQTNPTTTITNDSISNISNSVENNVSTLNDNKKQAKALFSDPSRFAEIRNSIKNDMSTKQNSYAAPSVDALKIAFESLFDDPSIGISTYTKTPPTPPEYDNMEDKDNIKIAEKFPVFGFGSLLDEILEGYGGVQEILRCTWNELTNEGEVACLMKDWRVFRYYMKQNDFSALSQEDRISKIDRECLICEDMDDWGHWEELGGSREEQNKKAMQEKAIQEKQTVYGEKMNDAMNSFFNGDISKLVEIIAKNPGKKSILEAEA